MNLIKPDFFSPPPSSLRATSSLIRWRSMRPDPSGCTETITLSARVRRGNTPPPKKNHPGSRNVLPIGTSRSNESRQARPRVLLFIEVRKKRHTQQGKRPPRKSPVHMFGDCQKERENRRENRREKEKKTFRHG